MRYALFEDKRVEPTPGGVALCQCCGSDVVAKCGKQRVWHWAHKSKTDCDRWWEPETEWHRNWKDNFPKEWQEIVHFAPNGEKHIADVKTPSGLVIEFQHSPISREEQKAREDFYGDMLWIVDSRRSKSDLPNFQKHIGISWFNLEHKKFIQTYTDKHLPKAWRYRDKLTLFDFGFLQDPRSEKIVVSPLVARVPRNSMKVMMLDRRRLLEDLLENRPIPYVTAPF